MKRETTLKGAGRPTTPAPKTLRRREQSPARPRHFVGTSPPSLIQGAVWEIHRDASVEQFGIYLDGQRIGSERGSVQLLELLVGARLPADAAQRVLATLKTSPIVFVEVEVKDSLGRRKPAVGGARSDRDGLGGPPRPPSLAPARIR
jgi:hypothetical protein